MNVVQSLLIIFAFTSSAFAHEDASLISRDLAPRNGVEMNLNPKEQLLNRLESTDLDNLWIQFLKIQSDLFFDKEFAPIFDQTWWHEARDVLEIRSGNGDLLAKMSAVFPDKKYVGIDQQSASVSRAQEHFQSDRLTFFEWDAECFQEAFSNQFDVVIFRLTLQHLKQPKIALEHAYRYLKKGGHIYIVDSHDASRQSSYPTPLLDKAVKDLNEQNRDRGKGNRLISIQIQQELNNQTSSLSPHFSVRMSNLDDEEHEAKACPQVMISSKDVGDSYRDYYLLFLKILNKGWNIPIDFEQAYEEASYFVEHKDAWLRSGKHLLLLERKE
jgi:ubiquinone/menaquinone biosynthesis C-methylase UbiE